MADLDVCSVCLEEYDDCAGHTEEARQLIAMWKAKIAEGYRHRLTRLEAENKRLRDAITSARDRLDYSLKNHPEKDADARIWRANMDAYNILRAALNPPKEPPK